MMKENSVRKLCEKAKRSSRLLACVETSVKNRALQAMGRALSASASYIIKANGKDLCLAKKKGVSSSLVDRLLLTEARISDMESSVAEIAGLKDPVGEKIETRRRPNGLLINKVRVPIGVILIVYEARPNVTSDCIALCLKSSNAVILRGGSLAVHSNKAIFDIMNRTARKYRIPAGSATFIEDTGRDAVDLLLKQNGLIDLVIPRGGESLINEVTEKSRIPVIKHYKGVCHTYVDKSANFKMAEEICFNAKVQRPGVCNAMETLLVDEKIARRFLPQMIGRLREAGVEIRGCQATRKIAKGVKPATEKDWYAEYLGLILSVRVVKGARQAVSHIMKYGSYHSDAIITEDNKTAAVFLKEVDSACVYLNASTRFTDGGEFGKGAEIGISTDKIHARGPMGLEELTSYKYMIYGNGQIRK
jgi:glutamate-5-semialdehyde dehydrogenase